MFYTEKKSAKDNESVSAESESDSESDEEMDDEILQKYVKMDFKKEHSLLLDSKTR